jgi:hypothetical protein
LNKENIPIKTKKYAK